MLVSGVAATAMLVVTAFGPAPAALAGKGGDAAATGVSTADSKFAPDRKGGPVIAATAAQKKALRTIQAQIANYVATNGTKYTFASYWDAVNGEMVLETDAPADVVAAVTAQPNASIAEQQAASQLNVRGGLTTVDNFHRRDDVPAFWGGAGIAAGGICSTGYSVRNGAGTVFITTAGHCYANGTTVLTESGLSTVGTVSNRNLPTFNGVPRDVELIGGSFYAGRIYTGGITSTTSVPVFAAGEAFVGFANYCHSGRTTGENCGHTASSITGQVCTQTGCKSPVIVWSGGVQSAGGDSGSPFYVMDTSGRAWIRGHVIAGNGVTSYSEKWVEVAALLGVSIVTG
jgi:hypothetical protein